MLMLSAAVEAVLEVRKSRFHARVAPVADRAAALAEVAAMRARFPAASHCCWALLAGGEAGMSDDGEPSGTAGKPILNVLMHKDIGNAVAIVARDFGGVKLGAGGLVRAYGKAVSDALATAGLVAPVAMSALWLELAFALESRVRHVCQQYGAALLQTEPGTQLRLAVSVPATAEAAFCRALTDATQGRIVIRHETPVADQ